MMNQRMELEPSATQILYTLLAFRFIILIYVMFCTAPYCIAPYCSLCAVLLLVRTRYILPHRAHRISMIPLSEKYVTI